MKLRIHIFRTRRTLSKLSSVAHEAVGLLESATIQIQCLVSLFWIERGDDKFFLFFVTNSLRNTAVLKHVTIWLSKRSAFDHSRNNWHLPDTLSDTGSWWNLKSESWRTLRDQSSCHISVPRCYVASLGVFQQVHSELWDICSSNHDAYLMLVPQCVSISQLRQRW